MIRLRPLLAGALLAAGAAAQQPGDPALRIPAAETDDPPTPARIRQVEQAAAASPGRWRAVAPALREAAESAYARDRLAAADAWYHLFEWAALLNEPEATWTASWNRAQAAARTGGRPLLAPAPGAAPGAAAGAGSLGDHVPAGLEAFLLENAGFSEEFFSTLNPVDHLPSVFAILDGLHRRDPARFARYASLALAIALVYDVEPPAGWPHSQVTPQALPRRLPNPALTFDRLTRLDAQGGTYRHLARLRAEELKFVVDAAAPAGELDWADQSVSFPPDQLAEAYQQIRYRQDRADGNAQLVWNGGPYTLQAIRAQGGICIDQAYFATEAGKARGVPTLIFMGQGQGARHAWFGFLDSGGRWHLDEERYAELRLVTGYAIDPQTWTFISDHELQFLAERFRALPSYLQSRVHAEFANQYLAEGDAAAAVRSARKAVGFERRNVDGWETLAAAGARLGLPAPQQEAVLREAELAFSPRYPDLVRYYADRVCRSLRARGETSLADFEERGIAERLKGDRADLAILEASAILSRSIATQGIGDQLATYNAVLVRYGPGANTLFFDQVVVGFVEHLALLHLLPQARGAVERAREALDVQPGTQMAADVDRLLQRLQQ